MTVVHEASDEDLRKLADRVYAESGISLPASKMPLVQARLAKRSRTLGFSPADYCREALRPGNHEEFGRLLDALTTNKTSLYRESAHFTHLASVAEQLCREGQPLRLWSAACSSGEEAYCMAMCVLPQISPSQPLKILGTDLSGRMIDKALHAVWNSSQTLELPAELRQRFLVRESREGEGQFSPGPELRSICAFAEFNLNGSSWPFQHPFDAIFCRNVMIYFDRAVQQKLVNRLLSQLRVGGYLYTGMSENLLGLKHGLKNVGPSVYQKT